MILISHHEYVEYTTTSIYIVIIKITEPADTIYEHIYLSKSIHSDTMWIKEAKMYQKVVSYYILAPNISI